MSSMRYESQGGYEFSADQERTVARLANTLRMVAAPMVCLGLLVLIYLIMHAIWMFRHGQTENLHLLALPLFLLGVSVLFLAIGASCRQAGLSFRQIISTTGSDIGHLMSALNVLDWVFGLVAAFVKALILLTFLAMILNLIWLYTNRDDPGRLAAPRIYSTSR